MLHWCIFLVIFIKKQTDLVIFRKMATDVAASFPTIQQLFSACPIFLHANISDPVIWESIQHPDNWQLTEPIAAIMWCPTIHSSFRERLWKTSSFFAVVLRSGLVPVQHQAVVWSGFLTPVICMCLFQEYFEFSGCSNICKSVQGTCSDSDCWGGIFWELVSRRDQYHILTADDSEKEHEEHFQGNFTKRINK